MMLSRKILTYLVLSLIFVFMVSTLITVLSVKDFSDVSKISEPDFRTTFLPYRLAFYAVVLAAWKPIARLIARPRIPREDRTPEINQKWDELTHLLVKGWWKVALFFAVFELLAIQQLEFLS